MHPAHAGCIHDMEKVEMSQNLLSIALSDEDIAAINTALGDIESRLAGLVALDH